MFSASRLQSIINSSHALKPLVIDPMSGIVGAILVDVSPESPPLVVLPLPFVAIGLCDTGTPISFL